jgi:hypothetical protein
MQWKKINWNEKKNRRKRNIKRNKERIIAPTTSHFSIHPPHSIAHNTEQQQQQQPESRAKKILKKRHLFCRLRGFCQTRWAFCGFFFLYDLIFWSFSLFFLAIFNSPADHALAFCALYAHNISLRVAAILSRNDSTLLWSHNWWLFD